MDDEQIDETLAGDDQDDDFDVYAAEVEASLGVDTAASPASGESSEPKPADPETLRFAIDEIVRLGKWEELPAGLISELDEDQFTAFLTYRSTVPAEDDADEVDDRPRGAMIEDEVEDPAHAFLTMDDAEFSAHLAAVGKGA
jgi:hypothetical protein